MNSQFKRGIVELCVMKLLSARHMSTFEILQIISKDLDVNENTVYPILRRLSNEGLLAIEKSKEEGMGAPRKYYLLTDLGSTKLAQLEAEWNKFLGNVSNILGGNYEQA